MPTRNASAAWEGGLRGGKGTFSGESGVIGGEYSFGSRFGESGGTNPEELLAAAEAACFSMALSGALERGGHAPQSVETKAACTIEKVGDAFKITRMGELVGRAASEKLGVPFGIVDLSLAPTPAPGDSVGRVLEAMGLERVGTHGSTAALALLNDAVKKGGAMASSYVGGLSGAFIPVSEDSAMIDAAAAGTLSFDKLEAMTCVCSVGLDMIAVPGDTPATTIAANGSSMMTYGTGR